MERQETREEIRLLGRVTISGTIRAVTGLHIGGSSNSISIGGIDNTVIRDPLTDRPYIPGSSLKGKMRSLTERALGLRLRPLVEGRIYIHWCKKEDNYESCPVCHLYGLASEKLDEALPTRLVFRDVPLDSASADELLRKRTDLPYTEVKYEASIDRLTAAANPRPLERVPAGADFRPMEIVFNVYRPQDIDYFPTLVDGMHLLEDDYLGGSGSRGSGKVRFAELELRCKPITRNGVPAVESEARRYADVRALLGDLSGLLEWLRSGLGCGSER